jgi:hypothetical protein
MTMNYETYLTLSTSINEDPVSAIQVTHDGNYLEELLSLFKDIQYIAKSDRDEFSVQYAPSARYALLKPTETGKRILLALKRLLSLNAANDERREFHPALRLFQRLTGQHNIQQHLTMTDSTPEAITQLTERLNTFVRQFRSGLKTPSHKQQSRQYQRAARKNLCGALRYTDALFEQHARLLAVRVDLSYRNDTKATITAELARQHRQRFFKNLQAHRLFQACVGYIWKLEYGRYRGFHYHLLVFYDGARVRQDVTLARLLGEYWCDVITAGAGHYHNCNFDKARYRFPGIGLLHYTDAAKRKGLNIAVRYLCKVDTYARLALPNGARSFGRGEKVQPSAIRRGRPRAR